MIDYKNQSSSHFPRLPRRQQEQRREILITGLIILAFFIMLGLAGKSDYETQAMMDKHSAIQERARENAEWRLFGFAGGGK